MKRLAIELLLILGVPFVILGIEFCITDPYKTLRKFSLEYFDMTNRDYFSSELFLMNYPNEKYDSYIFGSSRGCGFNTYHWKKYLSHSSRQFLFQAWNESLTGICQKVDYLDSHDYDMNNVIILLDIDSSFKKDQLGTQTLVIKHPVFSGMPKWKFNLILFCNFVQKPSQWVNAAKGKINDRKPFVVFDPISNDWDGTNKFRDLSKPPQKDSLCNCSVASRNTMLKACEGKTFEDVVECAPLINDDHTAILRHIRNVFDKRGTDYKIVITPTFCYTTGKLNSSDKFLLDDIFGSENVYDYTGYNFLTNDYNNYSDPTHFGLYSGWYIIEDIYSDSKKFFQ